jgi:hypothetical protein
MLASRVTLTVLLCIAIVAPATAAADAPAGLTINVASYSYPRSISSPRGAGHADHREPVRQGHDFTARNSSPHRRSSRAAPDGEVELAAHETSSP